MGDDGKGAVEAFAAMAQERVGGGGGWGWEGTGRRERGGEKKAEMEKKRVGM